MRKLISLLAILLLSLHLVSCTSNDSKDDGSTGDEAVAESTEGTDGDLENLDAPASDSSSVAASDTASEGFLDEQLPEDALGESTSTASKDTAPPSNDLSLDDSSSSSTTAAADAPTSDSTSTETTPPPAIEESPTAASSDPMATLDTGTPAPTTEDSSSSSLSAMGSTSDKSSEPPAETKPKTTASLKKVEASPMTRSKVLLNAVYVARPGDTYKKISEMIYGNTSKQKELKKVNPWTSKPRPGDKIYYNSPVRPTDDTKMLTFYEDAGMVPEVYVAKDGDNIKEVSKNLLGYDNAWKEVWATNAVESKDTLAAGTELRYWKSAPAPIAPPPAEMPATPSTEVAANQMTEQPALPEMPPPPPANELPPPTAQNDLPPPPPAEMAPPPPPPAAELPPPPPPEAVNPPPPPPVAKKASPMGIGEEGMDQDMMMALGAAGIVAAGLALMIIVRKRRQNRDMATAFNDTQVGT